MAIREYLKENSLAIGITVSPSYASITGINELIAEQLGVRERVARKIYSEITGKLRGSGRVLVIDEAQHLTVRTLNHLRCISDESVFKEALLDGESVELLFRIARTNYGLRGAVNVFVNTAAVFGGITAPELARMAKEMNIG